MSRVCRHLRRCAELAEGAEAVFLLLVRQEAYGAVWRFLQKQRRVRHDMADGAGNPDPDAAESAAAEKMQTMQAQTDQLRSQLQDLKRIQKAKGLAHAAAWHDGAGRAPLD